MILEIFSSGPAETNSYLVGCAQTRKAVIIDVPFDSSSLLIQSCKKHDLHVEMILLTHSHWDHTAEASLLKEQLKVPIYIHKEDVQNLEEPGSDRLPLLYPIRAVKPDDYLYDGQILTFGELAIEVIHTPGHTPGGVCFYLKQQKALFSGDTLFKGTIGNLSFPTARPKLMWASLERLARLPKDTKVYPGHGPSTTIGAEEWLAHAKEYFG